MAMKDFDAARRAAKPKAEQEPVEFVYFGRDWVAKEIPDGMFIDAFSMGADEDNAGAAAVMRDLMDDLVIDDQQSEWRRLWRRGERARDATPAKRGGRGVPATAADPGSPGFSGMSMEDMRDLIGYVGEQQFGRPTSPSSNSSRSSGGTGTKSTRGTNAKAASPKRR